MESQFLIFQKKNMESQFLRPSKLTRSTNITQILEASAVTRLEVMAVWLLKAMAVFEQDRPP